MDFLSKHIAEDDKAASPLLSCIGFHTMTGTVIAKMR